MKSVLRLPASASLVIALALSQCLSVQAAETFVHPGGAYKFEPPAGYQRHAFVHGRGIPLHVFSPDKGEEADDFKRGIWVYAFPIPTDEQLEAADLTVLIRHLLTLKEPGLTVNQKAKAAGTLGALKAVSMPSQGRRDKGGAWQGRVLVAVQEDSYLVVHYGGPPKEWEEISKACEAALKTFVAPVKLISIDAPPEPAKPKTPAEAESLLLPTTPLVWVKWRKDFKDDATLSIENSSGSGFIIHSDGYVVTNRHVVETTIKPDGARVAYDAVRLTWDERVKQAPVDADVVAISSQFDLALLKIRGDAKKKWPVTPMADITDVRDNDAVTSGGWPLPDQRGDRRVSVTHGLVYMVAPDGHGRPLSVYHSSPIDHGNSGGPLYSPRLGTVIGANVQKGTLPVPLADGTKEIYVAVPIHRVLWEFPQIATNQADAKLSPGDRRALIAYYYLQKRYGAAMIECKRALAEEPEDGLASAYQYCMYQAHDDAGRAQESMVAALQDPAGKRRAMLLAVDIHMENLQNIEAVSWAQKLMQDSPNDKDGWAAMARTIGDPRAVSLPAFKDEFENDPEMNVALGRGIVQQWLRNVDRLPAERGPLDAEAMTARTALTKAMKMWPGHRGVCYANLAILAFQDGQKTKAQELHDMAIKAAPRDLEVRLTIARFDMLRGEHAAAGVNIQAALQIKETPHALHLAGWWMERQANLLERAGEIAKAQKMREVAYMTLEKAEKRRGDYYWTPGVLHIKAMVQRAYEKAK